jgi:hypothetical protein
MKVGTVCRKMEQFGTVEKQTVPVQLRFNVEQLEQFFYIKSNIKISIYKLFENTLNCSQLFQTQNSARVNA